MAGGSGGSIINISSMGAVRPRPDVLPYAAAKAGLNALTVGLAHAFGPTVRCNAIMAGAFPTDPPPSRDPPGGAGPPPPVPPRRRRRPGAGRGARPFPPH